MSDKIQLRSLQTGDAGFLIEALYHAIYVPPNTPPLPKTIVQHPDLAQYVDGFGTQPTDHGILALHDGTPIGAAWARSMHGYGFVDEAIPELSIALLPGYRGQGIGTRLLEALLNALCKTVQHVSLSVNQTNPARRLYERHGFTVVKVEGDSITMVCSLESRTPDD
jgi:ribosomal protein S18 acetylase RimI-like enzyme